jgi:hypothetical protein
VCGSVPVVPRFGMLPCATNRAANSGHYLLLWVVTKDVLEQHIRWENHCDCPRLLLNL